MEIAFDLSEVIQWVAALKDVLSLQFTTDAGLSSLSVSVHAFAYITYLAFTVRMKVTPSTTAWLMFAYGTSITAFLEYQAHAPWSLLWLPIMCALFSLYIAARSVFTTKDWWPKTKVEQAAFLIDLGIAIVYSFILPPETRAHTTDGFLALLALSSVLPFIPQYRAMLDGSAVEHWLPWLSWTLSYSLLTATTVLVEHTWYTVLILYPLVNAILHGTACVLAVLAALKRRAG